MFTKFWMVLGAGQPTYHHETKKSAQVEAERLARLSPGSVFTVLEAIACVRKDEMRWQQAQPDDPYDDQMNDVPF